MTTIGTIRIALPWPRRKRRPAGPSGNFKSRKSRSNFCFSRRRALPSPVPTTTRLKPIFLRKILNRLCRLSSSSTTRTVGWPDLSSFKNVLIERRLLDAPAAADLDGGKLTALHQIIDGRQRNPEIFGRFFDRQEVMHLRKISNLRLDGRSLFRLGEDYEFIAMSMLLFRFLHPGVRVTGGGRYCIAEGVIPSRADGLRSRAPRSSSSIHQIGGAALGTSVFGISLVLGASHDWSFETVLPVCCGSDDGILPARPTSRLDKARAAVDCSPLSMSALFFKRFLQRPFQVASIVPSSKALVKRVARKMDFTGPRVIAGMRPGRRRPLARDRAADVGGFAVDPVRIGRRLSHATCNDNSRTIRACTSSTATRRGLPEELKTPRHLQCDYILSGIPFSILEIERSGPCWQKTYEAARPMAAVSLSTRSRTSCGNTPPSSIAPKSRYFLQNIPPMFITVFHKVTRRNWPSPSAPSRRPRSFHHESSRGMKRRSHAHGKDSMGEMSVPQSPRSTALRPSARS